MSKLKYLLIVAITTFFANSLWAKSEVYVSGKKGSDIAVASEIKITDPFIGSGINNCLRSGEVHVLLNYEQLENAVYLANDFSVNVAYSIDLERIDGTIDTQTGNLFVDYSSAQAQVHQDKNLQVYNSQKYVAATLTINAITDVSGSALNTLPNDLHLDVLLQLDRAFELSTNAPSIAHSLGSFKEYGDGNGNYNENTNSLDLHWTFVQGAESFDLEWLFVNSGNTSAGSFTEPIDFRNATRVNVKDNHYSISLAYPTGYLLYRVRARGIDLTYYCITGNSFSEKSIEGPWSTISSNGQTLSQYLAYNSQNDGYPIQGFEKNLNWVYGINFAEGGKSSENIEFYDGSLRGRQSVASFNSDNNVVVTEKYYDTDGRLAVSTLPIPRPAEGMRLYLNDNSAATLQSFNGNFSSQYFNLDDQLDPDVNVANSYPQPMNSLTVGVSGTAAANLSSTDDYYSENNSIDSRYRDLIPQANGYPYTQTVYKNDGTNRVIAQSGPGEMHRIKSGQETQISYVTTNQFELDRLFGTEVGNYKYYKKTITKDANDQYSVQYLDNKGRVIATCLMGNNTESNLLDLDDVPLTAENVTIDIVSGKKGWVNNSRIDKYNFSVVDAQDYIFDYSVDGIDFDYCGLSTMKSAYEVQLYITKTNNTSNILVSNDYNSSTNQYVIDPVQVSKAVNSSYKKSSGASTSIQTTPSMNGTIVNPYMKISNAGDYTLTKKLSIDMSEVEAKKEELREKLELDLKENKLYWEKFYEEYYFDDQFEVNGYSITGGPITVNNNVTDPCIDFDMPVIEPCSQNCYEDCVFEFTELQSDGITYRYFDELGNYMDANNVLYTSSSSEYINAVDNCRLESECDVPQNIYSEASQCDKNWEIIKLDMSPGGQYFDNLITQYEINSITGTFSAPDGSQVENSSYNSNGWLSQNYSVIQFNTDRAGYNTSNGTNLASISSWDDLRDPLKWDEEYAEILGKKHPEFGIYEFYCDCNTSLSFLDDNRVKVYLEPCYLNAYSDGLYNSLNVKGDNLTFTIGADASSLTINPALPFGGSFNTSGPTYLYTSELGVGTSPGGSFDPDPLMLYPFHSYTSTGITYNAREFMEERLFNFVRVGGQYQSIWYVLDANYATYSNSGWYQSPSNNDEQAAKLIYDAIHHPTDGLLAGVPATDHQIEKLRFFISVYNNYRKYLLYRYFKNDAPTFNANNASAYWNTDADLNGYVDNASLTSEDNFLLIYPEPIAYLDMFLNWNNNGQNPSVEIPTDFVTGQSFNIFNGSTPYEIFNRSFIRDAAVTTVSDWMTQLYEEGEVTTGTPNVPLRTDLHQLAFTSGMNAHNAIHHDACFASSSCTSYTDNQKDRVRYASITGGSQANILNPSATTTVPGVGSVSTADQIVSLYLGNYTGIYYPEDNNQIVNGDAVDPAMNCNCDRIVSSSGYLDIDAAFTSLSNPAPNAASNVILANGLSNPQDQVKKWITVCKNQAGTFHILPDDDATWEPYPYGLECTDCTGQNWLDLINNLGLDLTSVSSEEEAELNDLFGINAGQISAIHSAVNSGGSLDGLNFPESLRCLGEPTYDLQEANADTCMALAIKNAIVNSEVLYRSKIESYIDEFEKQYLAALKDGIENRESLKVQYELNEYYYTLYYYDQAGNLVKTVPPEGVHPINLALSNSVTTPTGCSSSASALEKLDFARTNGLGAIRPSHKYVTRYAYNSFNQLTEQSTPDAGLSKFYYDKIDRLVVSQNAKQYAQATPEFSYTKYDPLGRIKEGGQVATSSALGDTYFDDETQLENWINTGTRTQVTFTRYDEANSAISNIDFTQNNLRNRVSSSFYFDTHPGTNTTINASTSGLVAASYYDYDIHGNVTSILQQNNDLKFPSNLDHTHVINYEYDLLSGNVNKVSYQPGKADAFYHRYFYDANNRLTEVETSTNDVIWEKQSKYFYYPHGPLAREEIGDKIVQGKDYAYTIQGWLKGVNASTLKSNRDMGKDAFMGNDALSKINAYAAKDAYGYSLSYYDQKKGSNPSSVKDYQAIGTNVNFEASFNASDAWVNNTFTSGLTSVNTQKAYASLYNGNISRMVVALQDNDQNNLEVHNNAYRYDQLNRIKASSVFKSNDANIDHIHNGNNFAFASHGNWDYATQYKYDKNGNIENLWRRDGNDLLDNLEYRYVHTTNNLDNKLDYVIEHAAVSAATDDIENQDTDNYTYDEIGNLISDKSEQIKEIKWTVSGKIKSIERTSGSTKPELEFTYDPQGNRISKTVKPRTTGSLSDEKDWVTTIYVRDATGNIMATYNREYWTGCTTIHYVHGSSLVKDFEVVYNGVTKSASGNVNDGVYAAINKHASAGIEVSYIDYGVIPVQMTIKNSNANCASEHLTIRTLDGGVLESTSSINFSVAPTEEHVVLSAQDIYGSSRLGSRAEEKTTRLTTFSGTIASPTGVSITYPNTNGTEKYARELGHTRYELANHLGNVLSTVSDRKIVDASGVQIEEYTFDQEVVYGEDFDDGTVGAFIPWPGWGNSVISNHQMGLKVVNSISVNSAIYNEISVVSGEKYEVVFDVDFEIGSDLKVDVFETGGAPFLSRWFTITSASQVRVLFEAPSNSVRIVLGNNGAISTFKVDNFQLLKESEDIGRFNTSCVYTRENVNGKMIVNTNVPGSCGMNHTIPTVNGHTFKVSLDVVIPAGQSWNLNAKDEVNNQWYPGHALVTGHNEFTISANSNNTRMKFECQSSGSSSLEVDNISIVDLTEKQYIADVMTTSDYYPFGAPKGGNDRNFSTGNYRYGFNGKEKDPEGLGGGHSTYDYGFRIYNPALGRFLSVDPLTASYPWYTPYQFAGNMPIWAIDLDGLEEYIVIHYTSDGTPNGDLIYTAIVKLQTSWKIDANSKEVVYFTMNADRLALPDGNMNVDHARNQVYGKDKSTLKMFYSSGSWESEFRSDENSMMNEGIANIDELFGKTYATDIQNGKMHTVWVEEINPNADLFLSGSSELSEKGKKRLNGTIYLKMLLLPNMLVEIEGHTDSDGSEDANMKLSIERAEAIKRYLESLNGIETGRITTSGKGESEPVATNENEEGKRKNRRVLFKRKN